MILNRASIKRWISYSFVASEGGVQSAGYISEATSLPGEASVSVDSPVPGSAASGKAFGSIKTVSDGFAMLLSATAARKSGDSVTYLTIGVDAAVTFSVDAGGRYQLTLDTSEEGAAVFNAFYALLPERYAYPTCCLDQVITSGLARGAKGIMTTFDLAPSENYLLLATTTAAASRDRDAAGGISFGLSLRPVPSEPTSGAVPEPQTLSLAGIALLGGLYLRRER